MDDFGSHLMLSLYNTNRARVSQFYCEVLTTLLSKMKTIFLSESILLVHTQITKKSWLGLKILLSEESEYLLLFNILLVIWLCHTCLLSFGMVVLTEKEHYVLCFQLSTRFTEYIY